MRVGIGWDKDGPLCDSFQHYCRYLDIVLTAFDRPAPWAKTGDPRPYLRGDYEAMYASFGIDYEKHSKRIWELFSEHFEYHTSPLHPSIFSLLNRLVVSGISNGVVSTARTAPLNADLRRGGVDSLLAPVISHDHVGNLTKPHPLGILLLDGALAVDKLYFVGDLVSDIDTVHNARPYTSTRLVSVAVGYGWGHPDVLATAKPDVYCASVADLRDFFATEKLFRAA
jgi:phosphoglycolate phosphatase-like HAD superfamily hydrolase